MNFLGVLALPAVSTQFLETVCEKIELLNKAWSFISYQSRINGNKLTLKRKLEALCSLEDDINENLEVAELHPRKKRKREVDNWLRNVQRKKNEVQEMEHQIEGRRYSLGPWWEKILEKHISEVEELSEQGEFPEGLLLNVLQTAGDPLLTVTLVGLNSNEAVAKISRFLRNNALLRIGVYGAEGVGKTAAIEHVHNKVPPSYHVYLINISDNFSIQKLQSDIAKQAGIDLSDEEDTRKRAAILFKLLRKNKSVLILDNLKRYFNIDDVGIPDREDGCKIIIVSRSLKVCRQMACEENIEIERLSGIEAENLFKAKLGLGDSVAPEIEEISKQIIEKCEGLPLKIISVAETMRGVDDVIEWRNTLNEIR